MFRLALLTLLIAAPLAAQADALVARLADTRWEVRERAQRDLVGLGEAARKDLVANLEHTDLEVRSRVSAALIAIGESFAHAVKCATAEGQGSRDHGRKALANLFRIDDPKNLRLLTDQELQQRYYGGQSYQQLSAPPALALARLEAISGMRVMVSPGASDTWQRFMSMPSADLHLPGDARQAPVMRNALAQAAQRINAESADRQLSFLPMRVGRQVFFYVVTGEVRSSQETARQAGENMIEALLGTGAGAIRAASLLAEGAAMDVSAADRIRAEFLANPGVLRLLWLVLGLGHDEAVAAAVRKLDPAPILEGLDTSDWAALQIAGAMFACLEPAKRAELLAPLATTLKSTVPLTAILWWLRGCDLPEDVQARALGFVSSRQDALAASAVRWFAGASDVTDAQLDAIWRAAESAGMESALFNSALELMARADLAPRLTERARTALAGNTEQPAVLAAVVLTGRATPADLRLALPKLGRDNIEVTQRVAQMFRDCDSLEEEAITALVDGLLHDNQNARPRYHAAVRHCAPALRGAIAKLWAERVDAAFKSAEAEGDITRLPRKFVQSRLHLWAFQAALGDPAALESLMAAAGGDDLDSARWAGSALTDAMDESQLLRELETMRNRPKPGHAVIVSNEAWMEMCRRAVSEGDRTKFRRFFGLITSQQYNAYYQMLNELTQLQTRLNRLPDSAAAPEPMPPNPVLTRLQLE